MQHTLIEDWMKGPQLIEYCHSFGRGPRRRGAWPCAPTTGVAGLASETEGLRLPISNFQFPFSIFEFRFSSLGITAANFQFPFSIFHFPFSIFQFLVLLNASQIVK
jgi:hypothetical protein